MRSHRKMSQWKTINGGHLEVYHHRIPDAHARKGVGAEPIWRARIISVSWRRNTCQFRLDTIVVFDRSRCGWLRMDKNRIVSLPMRSDNASQWLVSSRSDGSFIFHSLKNGIEAIAFPEHTRLSSLPFQKRSFRNIMRSLLDCSHSE